MLEIVGVGGKNLVRLAEAATLDEAQAAVRALKVAQLRGAEIKNPPGWVVRVLDGEIVPDRQQTAEHKKDRCNDRQRIGRLKATSDGKRYFDEVERTIAGMDDEDFFRLAIKAIESNFGELKQNRTYAGAVL